MILKHILKDRYLRIAAAISIFILFLTALIFSEIVSSAISGN